MMAKAIKYLLAVLLLPSCGQTMPGASLGSSDRPAQGQRKNLRIGAERTDIYLPLLNGRSVGIIANQTSVLNGVHLVDTLLASGVDVKRVFAPEHGFRGKSGAGEKVKDGLDEKTGVPIVSLYGNHYKPSSDNLRGLDAVIFDIQDVGARFYTYISTMSHAMEACAENGVAFVVLDRPNPNGHYVDGPVLESGFSSFVGLHEVPVVHGMTVGEYARMVNEEGWLTDGIKCNLTVIEMENYGHSDPYEPPIPPSPNLPNQRAIYLYPSLCFLEGTVVSEGRGTDKPFQQFGFPGMENGNTDFVPREIPGVASNPKFNGEKCEGLDLSYLHLDSLSNMRQLNLDWLITAYTAYADKRRFFRSDFFDKLAGSSDLREQITAGRSAEEIRVTWQAKLTAFKKMRDRYLLYP